MTSHCPVLTSWPGRWTLSRNASRTRPLSPGRAPRSKPSRPRRPSRREASLNPQPAHTGSETDSEKERKKHDPVGLETSEHTTEGHRTSCATPRQRPRTQCVQQLGKFEVCCPSSYVTLSYVENYVTLRYVTSCRKVYCTWQRATFSSSQGLLH